jgi:hypothetical protein
MHNFKEFFNSDATSCTLHLYPKLQFVILATKILSINKFFLIMEYILNNHLSQHLHFHEVTCLGI